MIARGRWRYWHAEQVCGICEHFRERDGRVYEPRGVSWTEDRCGACDGAVLICADCGAGIQQAWQMYKDANLPGWEF